MAQVNPCVQLQNGGVYETNPSKSPLAAAFYNLRRNQAASACCKLVLQI